jgi:hypothetical protein
MFIGIAAVQLCNNRMVQEHQIWTAPVRIPDRSVDGSAGAVS